MQREPAEPRCQSLRGFARTPTPAMGSNLYLSRRSRDISAKDRMTPPCCISDRSSPYYLTGDPQENPHWGKPAEPELVPTFDLSLDQQNLTVETASPEPADQQYRFRNFVAVRTQLMTLILAAPLSDGQRARFRGCGRNAWVQWSRSREVHRVRCDTCKLRFCPACARAQGKRVSSLIGAQLENNACNAWKLITLTLRHSSGPLREQLANLKASFRRLRQRRSWKKHVTGGFAVVEVTRNVAGNQWHPHVHIVAWSKFYDSRELSREWKAASKGSFVVDIKPIRTKTGVEHYLAKYLAKGVPDSVVYSTEHFSEWVEAMRGNRLFIRFGAVPDVKPDAEDDGLINDWEPRCSLVDLIAKEIAGNRWAKAIMQALRKEHHEIDNLFAQDTG